MLYQYSACLFLPSKIEKHKTYHIKDEQLARDGFKKFLKNEPCPFERCRFSRQCNHIHCVRENCFYVLHSSGQLLSHKRKHERMDSEQAYRRFKMAQKVQLLTAMGGSAGDMNDINQTLSPPLPSSFAVHGLNQTSLSSIGESPESPSTNLSFSASNCSSPLLDYNKSMPSMLLPTDLSMPMKSQSIANPAMRGCMDLSSILSANIPIELLQQYQKLLLTQQQKAVQEPVSVKEEKPNDGDMGDMSLESGIPKSLIQNVDFGGRINSFADNEQLFKTFFTNNCGRQQHSSENNGRHEAEQCEPLNLNLKSGATQEQHKLIKCTLSNNHVLADQRHSHCLLPGCEAVLPTIFADIIEHLRDHQMVNRPRADSENVGLSTSPSTTAVINDSTASDPKHLQITSIDGFFNRKRGRPPKNRVVEVYNNVSILILFSILSKIS